MPLRLVEQLHRELEGILNDVGGLFVPGAKITLLVRQPSHPDGTADVVVSNDTIDDAVAALLIRKVDTRGTVIQGGG